MISAVSRIISITRGHVPENSSDLDEGRRPEPKTDEFSGTCPLGDEIMRCEVKTFSEKCFPYSVDHSWGLSPQLKSVEFSFLPNVVHELQSILYVKPLKKVLHFMGSGPHGMASSHPSM